MINIDELKEILTYQIRKRLLTQGNTAAKDIGVIRFNALDLVHLSTEGEGEINNLYYESEFLVSSIKRDLNSILTINKQLSKEWGVDIHDKHIHTSDILFDLQGILNQISEHREDTPSLKRVKGTAIVNVQLINDGAVLQNEYTVKFNCALEGDKNWVQLGISCIQEL